MTRTIADYQDYSFPAPTRHDHVIEHDVYHAGVGAPVLIIQELPGIGPQTFALADQFIEQGFSVYMPHLFGPIGRLDVAGNLARVFCMRKEFSLFARKRSSPIVDWLQALCQDIRTRTGAAGVGVIGMCLTGNFALSMIGDDNVLAAVASQPAMPFLAQSSLHMSAEEIAQIKTAIDKKAPARAYRFAEDWMSTARKFDCIDKIFNTDGKQRVELTTIPGPGHAVLTIDFVDQEGHPTRQALDEVLAYFKQQLQS